MGDYRRSASPFGLTASSDVNSQLSALMASARLMTGSGDPIIQKREWQRA